MKCAQCGLEAMIQQSRTELEGDDAPEKQTQIFVRLTYHCRNPRCGRYGTAIGEARHRVYPGPEAEPAKEVRQ